MRHPVSLLVFGCALIGVGFSACVLGLDESKIGESKNVVEASVIDSELQQDSGTPCNADMDCKGASGCQVGQCNMATHQCSFVICPVSACQASTCVANTCTPPTTYGFHSASFTLPGALACGARCAAAAYPFLFLGTDDGVIARSVANPADTSTTAIPVGGVAFLPQRVIASGSRVYFVGTVGTTAPGIYKLPLAWLDVPSDPNASSLTATSIFETVNVPTVDAFFADMQGGLYLSYVSASFSTAYVSAPTQDSNVLEFWPLSGSKSPIAASGSRLVSYTGGAQYLTIFDFQFDAGTPDSGSSGPQDITSTFGMLSAPTFVATGSDGSLIFAGDSVQLNDGGALTQAMRVGWILANANATTFDGTQHLDVQTYPAAFPPGSNLAGPIAWLDSSRMLVASAGSPNVAQTEIQIATREAGAPALVANRNFILPLPPASVAIAAANGFGYVVSNNATAGIDVNVFATGCDNANTGDN